MVPVMKNKIAIFDIDGTIFRSSLLIQLNFALVEYGIFPPLAKTEIDKHRLRWIDRKDTYQKYIEKVVEVFNRRIRGCHQEDFEKVGELVVGEQKNRVYTYTRELIKNLRGKYFLLAISGSPQEVVKAFNQYWKFDDFIAYKYETDKEGFYTGRVLSNTFRNKKQTVLDYVKKHNFSLKDSIGVGDTEVDVGFLELVSQPICFNPNHGLYHIAKEKKWKIVVERKDVIYNI